MRRAASPQQLPGIFLPLSPSSLSKFLPPQFLARSSWLICSNQVKRQNISECIHLFKDWVKKWHHAFIKPFPFSTEHFYFTFVIFAFLFLLLLYHYILEAKIVSFNFHQQLKILLVIKFLTISHTSLFLFLLMNKQLCPFF